MLPWLPLFVLLATAATQNLTVFTEFTLRAGVDGARFHCVGDGCRESCLEIQCHRRVSQWTCRSSNYAIALSGVSIRCNDSSCDAYYTATIPVVTVGDMVCVSVEAALNVWSLFFTILTYGAIRMGPVQMCHRHTVANAHVLFQATADTLLKTSRVAFMDGSLFGAIVVVAFGVMVVLISLSVRKWLSMIVSRPGGPVVAKEDASHPLKLDLPDNVEMTKLFVTQAVVSHISEEDRAMLSSVIAFCAAEFTVKGEQLRFSMDCIHLQGTVAFVNRYHLKFDLATLRAFSLNQLTMLVSLYPTQIHEIYVAAKKDGTLILAVYLDSVPVAAAQSSTTGEEMV